MCGIIGIVGLEPVIERAYEAALRLTNRGMHSTGFVTFDEKRFHRKHGHRTADVVLEENHPTMFNANKARLKGNSGIAHTRYPTSGAYGAEDAQPVFHEDIGIATCSNGDILNLTELEEKLDRRGHFANTGVDAKTLQLILADEMKQNRIDGRGKNLSFEEYTDLLFKSIEELDKQVLGAWSCVNVMPRGLLAIKDPHGIKPLCWGKRYKKGKLIEVAFFSESSVFNMFGDYQDIREMRPGEAIFVERDTLEIKSKTISPLEKAMCFFEYNYFAMPDSRIDGLCVGVARKRLGAELAKENQTLKDKIDYVIPIPATGISAAMAISHELEIESEEGIIKISKVRSFQEPSQEKRKRAIGNKFAFIKEYIRGKIILTIDDSNVRGNTGMKIAQKLYSLGAKKVILSYFTPPIIGSCPYGIDTPERNKLIAYRHLEDEKTGRIDFKSFEKDMFGRIKVDEKPLPKNRQPKIVYISRPGLYNGLGRSEGRGLCTGCITGSYPHSSNPNFKKYMKEREKLRKQDRKNC